MTNQKTLGIRRYLIAINANLIIFLSVISDNMTLPSLPPPAGTLLFFAAILSLIGILFLLLKRFKLFNILTLIAMLIWWGCIIYTILQSNGQHAM